MLSCYDGSKKLNQWHWIDCGSPHSSQLLLPNFHNNWSETMTQNKVVDFQDHVESRAPVNCQNVGVDIVLYGISYSQLQVFNHVLLCTWNTWQKNLVNSFYVYAKFWQYIGFLLRTQLIYSQTMLAKLGSNVKVNGLRLWNPSPPLWLGFEGRGPKCPPLWMSYTLPVWSIVLKIHTFPTPKPTHANSG